MTLTTRLAVRRTERARASALAYNARIDATAAELRARAAVEREQGHPTGAAAYADEAGWVELARRPVPAALLA